MAENQNKPAEKPASAPVAPPVAAAPAAPAPAPAPAPSATAAAAPAAAAPAAPAYDGNAQIILVHPLSATLQKLKTYLSSNADVTLSEAGSAQEAIQVGLMLKPCIVIAGIQNQQDVAKLFSMAQVLKQDIKRGNIKTIITSNIKQSQIISKFESVGCHEYIVEPIPEKQLQFKMNLHIKANKAARKKQQEVEMKKVLAADKTQAGAGDGKNLELKNLGANGEKRPGTEVKPGQALENPDVDKWVFKQNKPQKKGSKWAFRMEGPDPKEGTWQKMPETPEGESQWRFMPKNPDEAKKGSWQYTGEEPTPDENGGWNFNGKKPELTFVTPDGKKAGTKVSTDAEGNIIAAPDNPEALKQAEEKEKLRAAEKEKKEQAQDGKNKDQQKADIANKTEPVKAKTELTEDEEELLKNSPLSVLQKKEDKEKKPGAKKTDDDDDDDDDIPAEESPDALGAAGKNFLKKKEKEAAATPEEAKKEQEKKAAKKIVDDDDDDEDDLAGMAMEDEAITKGKKELKKDEDKANEILDKINKSKEKKPEFNNKLSAEPEEAKKEKKEAENAVDQKEKKTKENKAAAKSLDDFLKDQKKKEPGKEAQVKDEEDTDTEDANQLDASGKNFLKKKKEETKSSQESSEKSKEETKKSAKADDEDDDDDEDLSKLALDEEDGPKKNLRTKGDPAQRGRNGIGQAESSGEEGSGEGGDDEESDGSVDRNFLKKKRDDDDDSLTPEEQAESHSSITDDSASGGNKNKWGGRDSGATEEADGEDFLNIERSNSNVYAAKGSEDKSIKVPFQDVGSPDGTWESAGVDSRKPEAPKVYVFVSPEVKMKWVQDVSLLPFYWLAYERPGRSIKLKAWLFQAAMPEKIIKFRDLPISVQQYLLGLSKSPPSELVAEVEKQAELENKKRKKDKGDEAKSASRDDEEKEDQTSSGVDDDDEELSEAEKKALDAEQDSKGAGQKDKKSASKSDAESDSADEASSDSKNNSDAEVELSTKKSKSKKQSGDEQSLTAKDKDEDDDLSTRDDDEDELSEAEKKALAEVDKDNNLKKNQTEDLPEGVRQNVEKRNKLNDAKEKAKADEPEIKMKESMIEGILGGDDANSPDALEKALSGDTPQIKTAENKITPEKHVRIHELKFALLMSEYLINEDISIDKGLEHFADLLSTAYRGAGVSIFVINQENQFQCVHRKRGAITEGLLPFCTREVEVLKSYSPLELPVLQTALYQRQIQQQQQNGVLENICLPLIEFGNTVIGFVMIEGAKTSSDKVNEDVRFLRVVGPSVKGFIKAKVRQLPAVA